MNNRNDELHDWILVWGDELKAIGVRAPTCVRLVSELEKQAHGGRDPRVGYLFRDLKKLMKAGSDATVARALKALTERGLLHQRKLSGKRPRYFYRRSRLTKLTARGLAITMVEDVLKEAMRMVPKRYDRGVAVVGRKRLPKATQSQIQQLAAPFRANGRLRGSIVVIDLRKLNPAGLQERKSVSVL